MRIADTANSIIKIGFYLLFLLVPLVLTPWNYELFEYNKMMVTYAIAAIILSSWGIKMIADRKISIRRTPLDLPLLLFFFSQLISSIFSLDPHVSWNGYYSRFNGGMWSVITYIGLYYAFVSNWTDKRSVFSLSSAGYNDEHEHSGLLSLSPLLKTILATAAVVALYGVFERMGIDKHLWVQDVQTRVFSTLGQPNWLAAYIVALLPLGMLFTISSFFGNTLLTQPLDDKRTHTTEWHLTKYWNFSHIFWISISILFFLTLLFTRSRSGLMGVALAFVLFWSLLLVTTKKLRYIATPFIAFVVIFGAITFVNGSNIDIIDRYVTLSGVTKLLSRSSVSTVTPPPSPATDTAMANVGGTESGTIRKYVWQGALIAWQSSTKAMLIGTGTETFAFAFFRYKPVEHNMTSEWDFLYNKAHNEYLNYLTTTGIVGLGSYLLLIAVTFVWFMRIYAKDDRQQKLLVTALAAGYVSILVTNFFGFSVVIIQLLFFLFPAFYAVAQTNTSHDHTLTMRYSLSPVWAKAAGVFVMAIGGYILFSLGVYWYADTLFAKGNRYSRAGKSDIAYHYLDQAVALRPSEPMYHDELATTLATLALDAINAKDATRASNLAQLSVKHSDIALRVSPNNVNFWKSRTKVFYAFSAFDHQYNQYAIKSLETALLLSPNDPKITYNLAVLYGRGGENEKAVEELKKTILFKKDYRDAYYALFVFYQEIGKPELARQILGQYLKDVNPKDTDFQEKMQAIK